MVFVLLIWVKICSLLKSSWFLVTALHSTHFLFSLSSALQVPVTAVFYGSVYTGLELFTPTNNHCPQMPLEFA